MWFLLIGGFFIFVGIKCLGVPDSGLGLSNITWGWLGIIFGIILVLIDIVHLVKSD